MVWHDATKKIPQFNKTVLVCNQDGNVYTAVMFRQDPQGHFVWSSQYDNEHEKITHWMDLPEAPKEQNYGRR